MATKTKRARQPNGGGDTVKASVFLSQDLHRALRVEAAARNISVSRLASETLEKRFGAKKAKTAE